MSLVTAGSEFPRASAVGADADAAAASQDQHIAIIGMACRLPGAESPEDLWRNLREGRESIARLSRDDLLSEGVPPEMIARPEYVPVAAVLGGIEQFDASLFGFSPREAALLDPQQRIFLECAAEVLERAGVETNRYSEVGVYAGANVSSYLLNVIVGSQQLPTGSQAFNLLIHNDKDYLATRTSYKLGLKGPAISVQTACSTSLVAVHLACQGLLDGECDMAIAGGVSIKVPHRVGYLYEEGLIFSRDGHCRPFDASATGTVFGSGAGVVLLKRFVDAVADRDQIEAVVIGSAINNDGASKVGYTAPSVTGQIGVISAALAVAEVDPLSIGAVEAHGTGTQLGDPIELTALSRALRRGGGEYAPCAVSSIKSNVGHLDTAAGIAGLLKAVLQLLHRKLAPSLHFQTPNPHVDLDSLGICVNDRLRDWEADGPLRIGVSSFGIGGTNAHLIVEEASSRPPSPPDDRPQLMLLSARTSSSLDQASAALTACLGEDPATNLADAAYTLQTGRHRHRHRRAIVVSGNEQVHGMTNGVRAAQGTHDSNEARRRLVFVMPGQGSQHAGMARGLYQHEQTFRADIDAMAEVAEPRLGYDVRDVLFDTTAQSDELLRQTELAQPTLFMIEHALARLLGLWGLHPDVLIGHSIGELTAACLAGVLDRDDALRLVIERGRLMQQRPPGSMLSVGLSADALVPLFGDEISLAASNGPKLSVASGPSAAIEALAGRLRADNVPLRQLQTSHAFHSASMDPVIEPFRSEVQKVLLREPQIPFISNISGTWITSADATSSTYWAQQLRRPVRFGEGILQAVGGHACVVLEVGPGQSLGHVARQVSPAAGQLTVIHTMRHSDSTVDDFSTLMEAIGRLWLSGVEIDWVGFHHEGRHRVRLPTYPFERQRYWITAPQEPTRENMLDLRFELPEVTEGAGEDGRAHKDEDSGEPRTVLERQIAELWTEFLGFSTIGRSDDFFELGGNSLVATQIVSELRQRVGLHVELRDLIEHPTIAGLAGTLETREPIVVEPHRSELQIVPDPAHRNDAFPLTDLQQAQWLGRTGAFDVGDVAAHIYIETMSTTLDVGRLVDAWHRLVAQHDMLRAVVLPDGQQCVLPNAPPHRINVLDLSNEPADQALERLAAMRSRMSTSVHDPHTWPLWELAATVLPSGAIHVHLSFDLMIADVSSLFFRLLPDWRELYEHPDRQPVPLELSFRDYVLGEAELRNSERYALAFAYWRARAAELPPAPELPTLRSFSEIERPEFSRRHYSLDAQAWNDIKREAAKHGVTPSVAVLAAYAAALATFSRHQRFTLNVTAVNRWPMHPDVNRLVGEFASFSLLEVDALTPSSFSELACQLQEQSWADLEHREVGGVRVLRELARIHRSGQGAVMPIVFTSVIGEESDVTSLSSWLGEVMHTISQTPQVTLDAFVMEAAGGLDVSWHALTGLFADGLLDDLFDAFVKFLGRLVDDGGWGGAATVPLPARQAKRRRAVNDTAGVIPSGLLQDSLLWQASQRPEATAVITEEATVSFGELAGRSLELAQILQSRGISRGARVGIDLAKGWRQIVAVLGILNAGAAYVPIDPSLPQDRRNLLARDAEVDAVLVDRSREHGGDWTPDVAPMVTLPEQESAWQEADPEGWICPAEPSDVAYIVYTSGSTGTPKGVAVAHRAALNTCVDVGERFGLVAQDRLLGVSSLSFDLSVFDIFGVLGVGGGLVLPGPETLRDPHSWTRLIREHEVTVWNSVPALAEMLAAYLGPARESIALKLVLLSGDWIPVSLPDQLRAVSPGAKLISLGGATEAAIWSIFHPIADVSATWRSIPYGKPLRNQSLAVLNDRLEPCPTMVTGEIYIGGVGLAEGYWGDEERTRESFVFHRDTGERLYRTGDLGRYMRDGTIELLGREDNQVKARGHRIELGEIEHVIHQHDEVDRAVVIAHDERGRRGLVAYVTRTRTGITEDSKLRDEILALTSRLLPAYMVPRTVVVLDALPLSANGKIDRNSLPAPDVRPSSNDLLNGELIDIAERIARVFASWLNRETIGIHDNFFELGGDSVDGVRAIAQAASEGIDMTPRDIFEHQTIAELVVALAARGAFDRQTEAAGLTRLSCGQAQVVRDGQPDQPSVSVLALTTTEAYDHRRMRATVRALFRRHDALRIRIVSGEGEHPSQFVAPEPDDAEYLSEVDLSGLSTAERDLVRERMLAEIADELDASAGPMIKAVLFHFGDHSQLTWIGHRLAIDRASWPVLLRDLLLLYESASGEALPVSATPAVSFLEWARAHAAPGDTVECQRDEACQRTIRTALLRTVTLSAAEAEMLVEGLRAAYHMELGEGVLAALVWSFCTHTEAAGATVAVEINGRHELELVGPCAELVPMQVELSDPDDVGSVLKDVKAALAATQSILTGERPDDASAALLLFRDTGRYDVPLGDQGPLAMDPDFLGPVELGRSSPARIALDVAPVLVGGELRIACWCTDDPPSTAVADGLADRLRSIADHCNAPQTGELSPADFPLANLSQEELMALLDGLSGQSQGEAA